LGLKTQKEWFEFTKSGERPADIPALPWKTYKGKGWVSLGDWLGTGTVAPGLRDYRRFKEAREFARSLGLKNQKEWRKFTKSGALPDDIPANPNKTYETKGWVGMGDWLGTGAIATFQREYRSFYEAREFARSLGLKSQKEWFEFTKSGELPDDIPARPNKVYKDKGWKGMRDWLGAE
jgi:hypothetical protein